MYVGGQLSVLLFYTYVGQPDIRLERYFFYSLIIILRCWYNFLYQISTCGTAQPLTLAAPFAMANKLLTIYGPKCHELLYLASPEELIIIFCDIRA